MTKEEYMAQTNIKSPEEAQSYLSSLYFIWSITIISILFLGLYFLYPNINLPDYVLYIDILLIIIFTNYSTFYFYKVIKALNYSQGKSFFFYWVYWSGNFLLPFMAIESLKIIAGKKIAPHSTDKTLYGYWNNPLKEKDKKWKQYFLTVLASLVFLILIIFLVINSY